MNVLMSFDSLTDPPKKPLAVVAMNVQKTPNFENSSPIKIVLQNSNIKQSNLSATKYVIESKNNQKFLTKQQSVSDMNEDMESDYEINIEKDKSID